MITSSIRSKVTTLANALRYEMGFTASEAFKQAWKVIKAKVAMALGEVSFTYVKKDGSVRPATGTTDCSVTNYTPKANKPAKKRNPLYIRYYDMAAAGFRQFNAATFAA